MRNFHRPFADTFLNFQPLKPCFIQNRRLLCAGLLSLLAVDFLQLLIPLILKRAVDLLTLAAPDTRRLLLLSASIFGIALGMAAFRYLWRLLILGHSRKVEEGLRNRLYGHLQRLSFSFYQQAKTGDLMARAINDINGVRMATGMGLVALVDGLVLGSAAIGFMMAISVKLTLISLIPAPVVVVFSRILTKRMSAGFDAVQKTFSGVTERVREAFSGIRVIKAYHREDWQYGKVAEQGRRYIDENLRLAKTLGLFFPMMAVFTNAGLAVVIWMGGRLTVTEQITTGDFVAFISYLNLLTWPMMAMGWVTNLVQRGAACMRRINRILEEVPEIRDPSPGVSASRIRGEISIRGLTFRHPGQRTDALRDIRLGIHPGETVAVVGPVGCGKTTLLSVIPRILDPPPGTVFIDGNDIRDIPLGVLRAHIGFVTQEVFIFSDTIRNNVLFGGRDVPPETLTAALRAADILEYVESLDKGPDTLIGERGVTLSGGQRQRLTIARALIHHPEILILDDALSMVDTRTEERILARILAMRGRSTNFIVSHRPSTIHRAHRVLVMEKGRIVEEGRPEELLEAGGHYARLYEEHLLRMELEM